MISLHNMVSPQNGDTLGGPPPPPPSDATALGPGRTCIPKTGYFHDKTIISKAKSSIEVLFNAKHIAKGNEPCCR